MDNKLNKEILRNKVSKETLEHEKLSCQTYYIIKMLDITSEFNPEFFESGVYGTDSKQVLREQYAQLLEQKIYAKGYMEALQNLYEEFFDIAELKTWMSDADRKEAKNFREEQKYKTLNDYIYG